MRSLREVKKAHMHAFWATSIVAAIIVLLIIARAVLPYVLLHRVNQVLADHPDVVGHVEDLDLALLKGGYRLEGATMRDKSDGPNAPPLLTAQVVDLTLHWRALWRGHVVGAVDARGVKLRVVHTKSKTKTLEPRAVQEQVKRLLPFRINHVVVRNGVIDYDDESGTKPVHIVVDDVHLVATNLTNSDRISKSLVATLDGTGRVFHDGSIKLHADIDPFSPQPTFSLNAQATAIPLVDLNQLVDEKLKADFSGGTISVFSEARSDRGVYHGYVKPLLHDPRFVDNSDPKKRAEPGWKKLWESILQATGKVVENQEKRQVASKIPFHGVMKTTKIDVITAIVQLMKNGWVQALKPVIDGDITGLLAPAEAERRVRQGEKQTEDPFAKSDINEKDTTPAAPREPPKQTHPQTK